MGSACCVPERDKTLSNRSTSGESQKNAKYSPSRSFQWDKDPSCQSCDRMSTDNRREIKGVVDSDRGIISDWGSPLDNFGTPISQMSPSYEGISTDHMSPSELLFGRLINWSNSSFALGVLEKSMASNHCEKVNITELPEVAEFPAKLPFSMPSSSSFSIRGGHSCQQRHFLPPSSTPSRQARRSPGHQLFRQISDSRIMSLKSPNSNSLSEGRPSFVLSTFNNDLAGGSSDGWSLRTFSELVASSRRDRWSFDSEHFGSGRHKISGSSSSFSYSPTLDL